MECCVDRLSSQGHNGRWILTLGMSAIGPLGDVALALHFRSRLNADLIFGRGDRDHRTGTRSTDPMRPVPRGMQRPVRSLRRRGKVARTLQEDRDLLQF